MTHDGVQDASNHSDPNQPQSHVGLRFRHHKPQGGNQESWNVFKVIQMASSDSLDSFVLLNNLSSSADILWIIISLNSQLKLSIYDVIKASTYAFSHALSASQQRHQHHLNQKDSAPCDVSAEHIVVVV